MKLYGTLATTAPLYSISTLCNGNKKQIYNFLESSKSRMQRFEVPHVAVEPQFGHPWYMANGRQRGSVTFHWPYIRGTNGTQRGSSSVDLNIFHFICPL